MKTATPIAAPTCFHAMNVFRHVPTCAVLAAACLTLSAAAAPGDLDTTFNGTGVVTTAVGTTIGAFASSVAVQSDGKVLVAGGAVTGSGYDFALVRYTDTGALDTTFNGTGKVITAIDGYFGESASSVAVQSDGKILVAGSARDSGKTDFALVRYTDTGALDTTFNGTGIVTTAIGSGDGGPQSMAVQSDGKILVAGYISNGIDYDFVLVRYTSTGALDTTFSGNGIVTTAIGGGGDLGYSVAVQSDGKILVAGASDNGNNIDYHSTDIALVRYTSTGALDTTFNGTGMVTTAVGSGFSHGYSVAVQSDGKILVAGLCGTNASNWDFALVRYTHTGALDTTFNSTGKVITDFAFGRDEGYSVAVQSNGKIVVAGHSAFGFDPGFALARYTSTGALDTTFNGTGKVTTVLGTSNLGLSMALQSDEKILVAGTFYNGSFNEIALLRYEGGDPPPAPEIAVSGGGRDIAHGETAPDTVHHTDFGPVGLPGGSVTHTFTITNMGTAALTLSGTAPNYVTLSGAGAPQFSVNTQPASATVAADGGTATFQITFAPGAAGTHNATVSIASDDGDENPFTFVITGVASTPPVFAGMMVNTVQGKVTTIAEAKLLLRASDADGDPLSITDVSATSAEGAGIGRDGGFIYWYPSPTFTGTDTFTITISDGTTTTQGTVTMNVSADPGLNSKNPPQLTVQPGGALRIGFFGIPGRVYGIQRSDDLVNWGQIATPTAGPLGAVTFDDPSPPEGSAFYRIIFPAQNGGPTE